VAVEVKVPKEWGKSSTAAQDQKTRIVVIGHGGVFTGDDLSNKQEAVKEKLLLDCCNWLVGRDDLLGRDESVSKEQLPKTEAQVRIRKYPRVTLSDNPIVNRRELTLWYLGTQWGLPLFFGCLGAAVFFTRRLH
jgi:hypothetical protein